MSESRTVRVLSRVSSRAHFTVLAGVEKLGEGRILLVGLHLPNDLLLTQNRNVAPTLSMTSLFSRANRALSYFHP